MKEKSHFLAEVILKKTLLDVCVNQQRTLLNWIAGKPGVRLMLSVDNGEAIFEVITVRPLKSGQGCGTHRRIVLGERMR